jgi:uncharacterized protein
MTTSPSSGRRAVLRATAATAVTGLLALAGCGTPAPPPRLYQLPLDPPDAAPASPPQARSGPAWEIGRDIVLPAYLDRQAIVVARGGAGLQVLEGHRWAESLRDTVPRLLRHDLERLLGAGRVWSAPAPERVDIARRLRVELLSLQAEAEQSAVVLQARWWLTDPRNQAAPSVDTAVLRAPMRSAAAEDIARAHRQVLYELAQRIAADA